MKCALSLISIKLSGFGAIWDLSSLALNICFDRCVITCRKQNSSNAIVFGATFIWDAEFAVSGGEVLVVRELAYWSEGGRLEKRVRLCGDLEPKQQNTGRMSHQCEKAHADFVMKIIVTPSTGSIHSSACTECEPRNDKKVAFFAGQSNHFGPVSQNSDFVFDKLVTNVGSAYDLSSGRFTAPVKATYQFNVTISAQTAQKAAVNVVKNGAWIMTVWAESNPNWATSSNAAILSLEAGDQVWLQLLSGASYVYGNMYTAFSGFLLFQD